MADSNAAPLTDEERAELEELRAEKARREDVARARRERAELERLRAEKEQAETPRKRTASKPASTGKTSTKAAPKQKPKSKPQAASSAKTAKAEPAPQSFGVRMVTSTATSEDEIPGMPPAQKLIIVLAAVAVAIFAGYIALSNAGLI